MATVQAIAGILKKQGLVAQLAKKGQPFRAGFQVSAWNKGVVGVLLGTSDVEKIEAIKTEIGKAGFKVFKPENVQAVDGFFVEGEAN